MGANTDQVIVVRAGSEVLVFKPTSPDIQNDLDTLRERYGEDLLVGKLKWVRVNIEVVQVQTI
jgi:hypothetical protein